MWWGGAGVMVRTLPIPPTCPSLLFHTPHPQHLNSLSTNTNTNTNTYKYRLKKFCLSPPHLLLQQPPQHTTIVGKSVFASGNRFFEAQLSEFWGSTFRILRLNFPNSKAQLSEFSGWTFRIFRISLPNFPNFPSENQWGPFFFLGLTLRTFRICLNFPNFPDELSEFCSTFRIFPNFPD